jgi:hypothetical protein
LDRIKALKHAFSLGFRTSVSMGPMLGNNDEMCQLVNKIEGYVTDTIWLGKLNRGATSKGMEVDEGAKLEAAKIILRHGQNDESILALVARLNAHPKVRWTDSIKEVIAACIGTCTWLRGRGQPTSAGMVVRTRKAKLAPGLDRRV